MGIGSSIRNFFYAITHSNQLINENQSLQKKLEECQIRISTQKEFVSIAQETQDRMAHYEGQLKTAMNMLAPKDISLDTLRKLYVTIMNSPYSYENAGQSLLGNQWFARSLLRSTPVWDMIEKEVYRIALDRANILPYNQDFAVQHRLLEKSSRILCEQLGSNQLSGQMPVGRIDYLAPNGSVCESIDYRDAGSFLSDILQSNHYGEPMSITVYSDPANGAHINTSWRLEMDPPPQGFQVTPYQEPQAKTPEPAPMPEPEFEL